MFGVIQSSVLRGQPVPENSVSLWCCYEAIEASDLPTTLMELVGNAPSRTFLEDLLTLSYNIAVVSDRSGTLYRVVYDQMRHERNDSSRDRKNDY